MGLFTGLGFSDSAIADVVGIVNHFSLPLFLCVITNRKGEKMRFLNFILMSFYAAANKSQGVTLSRLNDADFEKLPDSVCKGSYTRVISVECITSCHLIVNDRFLVLVVHLNISISLARMARRASWSSLAASLTSSTPTRRWREGILVNVRVHLTSKNKKISSSKEKENLTFLEHLCERSMHSAYHKNDHVIEGHLLEDMNFLG